MLYHDLAAVDDHEMSDSQELPGGPRPVLDEELGFFLTQMNNWVVLRDPWKSFLQRFSDLLLSQPAHSPDSVPFVSRLNYLKSVHYGVANSMAHLTGQLLDKSIKQSKA